MGKVIDITDRLPPPRRIPGRKPYAPESTCWITATYIDEDGDTITTYEHSHPDFLDTKFGQQVEARKLLNIVLSLSEDDPALGAELLQSLEHLIDERSR